MQNEAASRPPAGHPRARRKAETPELRMRHGLYSSRAVITGESEAEYTDFRHAMLASLQPGDPMECALAEHAIQAQWKLKRLWAAETGLHRRHERLHPAPEDRPYSYPEQVAEAVAADNASDGNLHTLSHQEVRLTNIFHKALRHLELRQESRRKRFPAPEALQAAQFREVAISSPPRAEVAPRGWANQPDAAAMPPPPPVPAHPSNGGSGEGGHHSSSPSQPDVSATPAPWPLAPPSTSSDDTSSDIGISRTGEQGPTAPQDVPPAVAPRAPRNPADREPPPRQCPVIPFDPQRPAPHPPEWALLVAEDDKISAPVAPHRAFG